MLAWSTGNIKTRVLRNWTLDKKGLQLRARARERALARLVCSLRHFS